MSRRPKNIIVNAGSIELMFSKAPTEPLKKETKKCEASEKSLKSTDPLVQAFYDQLSPAEIIAHTIAVEKLGTSYDVVRTHGFIRWNKTRTATAAATATASRSR